MFLPLGTETKRIAYCYQNKNVLDEANFAKLASHKKIPILASINLNQNKHDQFYQRNLTTTTTKPNKTNEMIPTLIL